MGEAAVFDLTMMVLQTGIHLIKLEFLDMFKCAKTRFFEAVTPII